MGYVLAACAAVLLVVLILTRRSAEKKLSSSRPEAAEVSEQPSPVADNGIPPEIVAAIAAAVYCVAPGARIASLRPAPARPRSVWQTAGLLENTRPF